MYPSRSAFPLVLAVAHSVTASDIYARAPTDCNAASIPYPTVYGATVTSLVAIPITDYFGIVDNDVCQVNVTITHPNTGDSVLNVVVLPLTGWNGVFQGTGGGGYVAGYVASVASIAKQGYSYASTDAGHTMDPDTTQTSAGWALTSTGNVNQYLLLDFAYRSLHDMNVIGKAITESFYGSPPRYSYWNGCSTGGRQGLANAQRYPDDYDGILANAPAVQWNDLTPGQQWPYVVMNNAAHAPLQCEFDAIVDHTIQACDGLDGLMDGIISAPALCNFDISTLVGKSFICDTDGVTMTFKQKSIAVAKKILQGARTTGGDFLWYGLPPGTNFSTLANTMVDANGTSVPVAMGVADSWFRDFLYKDYDYDSSSVTYTEFQQLFLQSHLEYDSIMGTLSPDLRAFKRLGHKLLTWQGLADYAVFPQGTMLYYNKVLALDPTAHTFYRQFYSPGVGHCGGGTGVQPLDALGALRAWVENGTVPETLSAGSLYAVNASVGEVTGETNVRFVDLCPFPQVNKFRGGGRDPNLASSYECVEDMGWLNFDGPSGSNYSCEGGPGWY